ncbi:hypothetical protein HDU91_000075 [Kappamyces sp. JEL0680]|nr:hypothetical protein HDU91_000075 [Kappamyces sp. JEL0680]
MGCDGGSIPRREEMVKTKKAAVKLDLSLQIQAMFSTCALSKDALAVPVVSCALGKLYNKSSILQYLLNKSTFGDADKIVSHITSLKDVVSLNLTLNPLAGKETSSAIQSAFQDKVLPAQFICPVTLKEMNGNSKFCYLATCGCVVSEQALKTVQSSNCLVCSTPFSKDTDVVLINPSSEDEVAAARDRLAFLQEKKKKEKEEKKRAKGGKRKHSDGEPPLLGGSSSDEEKKKKKKKETLPDKDSKINMVMPDLSSLNAPKSKAIASLYHRPGEGDNKGNYLSRGTFNRYAAS